MGRQKKLQILVPQYNEQDFVVQPLLDSIMLQQAINFDDIGVIICNDGSDVHLSRTFLASYPYDIEYHKEPHRGVSGTRNACLDYSTAEYVMWCDADDIFYNACGLWIIFREIELGEFDSMTSVFVEEKYNKETGKTLFVTHEKDSTFVHGKVHRRQYLLDNEIRWDDSLTVHEDSYFNVLCQSLSENVKYCDVPFYLWKWRDDSVCRHDPKYMLKTYSKYIDSNDALVKEFERRERPNDAEFYVVMMTFDAYYTMNKPAWINQENTEYRDSTEKRFAEYFKEHKTAWDGCTPEHKMIVSNNIRQRQVKQGMGMETMTINDWLTHIEALA